MAAIVFYEYLSLQAERIMCPRNRLRHLEAAAHSHTSSRYNDNIFTEVRHSGDIAK